MTSTVTESCRTHCAVLVNVLVCRSCLVAIKLSQQARPLGRAWPPAGAQTR